MLDNATDPFIMAMARHQPRDIQDMYKIYRWHIYIHLVGRPKVMRYFARRQEQASDWHLALYIVMGVFLLCWMIKQCQRLN